MKGTNDSDKIVRKQNRFLRILFISLTVSLLIAVTVLITYRIINKRLHGPESIYTIEQEWKKNSLEGFKAVYDITASIISRQPVNNAARTYHGYSGFMLSQYDTDFENSKRYLDEAINNLRIAFMTAKDSQTKNQIAYMLGQSYFRKDQAASYNYYADLAVKYLTYAQENKYEADDIPLLLGLSYAALGETDKSIASFTQALLIRETDTLLYNIGKQYFLNNQALTAKQYLMRVMNTSRNEELLENAHVIMGQIYINEGNLEEAKAEFENVLAKNPNSADAHYELGIIYDKLGDSVKARFEWRKCLNIQPNYNGEKISDMR